MDLEENTPEVVDVPVENVVLEDIAATDTATAETEALAEAPAQSPDPEPKRKGPSDSVIGELTQQRARRREAEGRATALERQLDEAKALIDRLAAGKGGETTTQPTQPVYKAPAGDDVVNQRVAQALYERDVQGVSERGQKEFGASDFNSAATRFAESIGDAKVGFVREIMDVAGEKSHKVIFDLSNDLDRALAVRDMSPTRRAIAIHEMVQMTNAPVVAAEKSPLSQPAKITSKAPPPAPRISTGTVTEKPKTWASSDKMSESEFNEFFNARQKERRGMHR